MVELWVRLGVSIVAIGLTYGLERLSPGMALNLWVFVVLYTGGLYALDRRKQMNSGIAGFAAVADASAIASILGATSYLDTFGFLVLAPCAYAAARYGSLPTAMAPLAAATLFASHQIFAGSEPTTTFYGQVAAVLGLGLLLNHKRIVVSKAVSDKIGAIDPFQTTEPEGYLELRENFRKLKDMYRDLERKGRKDRITAKILETKFPTGDKFAIRIAEAVHELASADGVALYSVAQYDSVLVVQGACGDLPNKVTDTALPINLKQALINIRDSMDNAVLALQPDEARGGLIPVPLQTRGKTVGMLCLKVNNPARIDEVRETAEELAPLVAKLFVEEQLREGSRRRLRETELMYDTAVVAQGAETVNTLAARVVRELNEILDVDHLSVKWVDGNKLITGVTIGSPMNVFEAVRFEPGLGEDGWLRSGSPELSVFEAGEDSRCIQSELRNSRIGSLALFPIQFESTPFAVIVVATHRSGGIDIRDIETLRVVSAELGRALSELQAAKQGIEGLVTPAEFQKVVAEKAGALITLEAIKRDSLIEKLGKPNFDNAMRLFLRRVRSRLYSGGVVCRRPQGDIIAFLPGQTEHAAQSWANEIAASASMIGLRAPDGVTRVPLAIRAKVSMVAKESRVAHELPEGSRLKG